MSNLSTKVTPDLIWAAQRSNLGAFNRLVDEHQDTIYNLVCYLLPAALEAESVTQKVVQRLYRDLPAYQGGDFYLWMIKTVAKVCRSFMSQVQPTNGLDQPLQSCLANLSPDLRLVIVLVDLEGLDYAQTAMVLGTSRRAVRARLAKARRHILASKVQNLEESYV